MKKVFKTFIEYELNGKTTAHFKNRWKYGEIPEEETRFLVLMIYPFKLAFLVNIVSSKNDILRRDSFMITIYLQIKKTLKAQASQLNHSLLI